MTGGEEGKGREGRFKKRMKDAQQNEDQPARDAEEDKNKGQRKMQ